MVNVYQGLNEIASYSYDSAGRRHSKTIPNGSTTTYLYDADSLPNVLVEYKDGTWTRAYVYGPGIDEPLGMIEPDGDIYHYHQDGLGSVVALSDSAGVLVERYYYDVFGQPEQASSIGNPYLFTGRRYDSESGLYYYRARMYHPLLGRFLQTDPIGYEDGVNWCAYCGNNSGNSVDPTGLTPVNGTWGPGDTNTWDPGSGGNNGGGIDWGDVGDEYSKACYGVLNAILGGLFKEEYGIPYMLWGDELIGDAFKSGQAGWRAAEVALLAAGGCMAAGFDPWLGTGGIHPPHHGMGRHFEIIIRWGRRSVRKIIIPGKDSPIWIGP